MSSLIYFTNEDQAVVATDTLAVDVDGQPKIFVDKAFMLPRLRMIVAGTGAGGFADAWALQAGTTMAVRDIVALDRFTPAALREAWEKFKADLTELPEDFTTTVYHFGFEAGDGPMRVFVYRSTTGFQSEAQPTGGLGAKPKCTLPGDASVEWPGHFRVMMDEQREIQSKVPLKDRVHIGGEVNVIVLNRNDGFSCFTQSSFDDYPAQLEAVLRRHTR